MSEKAGPSAVQRLETLSPEAKRFFFSSAEDSLSFSDFMSLRFLGLASVRANKTFTSEDLKQFVDYDSSAPGGKKTRCALCLLKLILNEAERRHKGDPKMEKIVQVYDEMTKAMDRGALPAEILELQKNSDAFFKSLSLEELAELQQKFLVLKKEITNSDRDTSFLLPRRCVRIHSQDTDQNRSGEIVEVDGKIQYFGVYVLVGVNQFTCFRIIAFVLGLEPGFQILAGCGNPGDWRNDLYRLRNFCLKTPQDSRGRHWWQLLPATTYEIALERKQSFEKESEGDSSAPTLKDLWQSAKDSEIKTKKPTEEIWIEGEALAKFLDSKPDRTLSHTMRSIVLRKNILSGEWEICLLLEYGDAKMKTGSREAKLRGKAPAFGCPGGRVEPNELFGRTLSRESENEADFGEVIKVIALVSEVKKRRLANYSNDNIDHWFWIEVRGDQFASRRVVETDEIAEVWWVPLSKLANFHFQNSRRPIRNLEIIKEKKIMYFNHAAQLAKLLPRIFAKAKDNPNLTQVQLPDNFPVFAENLRKFQEELRYV